MLLPFCHLKLGVFLLYYSILYLHFDYKRLFSPSAQQYRSYAKVKIVKAFSMDKCCHKYYISTRTNVR